jgi:hypothetical protein
MGDFQNAEEKIKPSPNSNRHNNPIFRENCWCFEPNPKQHRLYFMVEKWQFHLR